MNPTRSQINAWNPEDLATTARHFADGNASYIGHLDKMKSGIRDAGNHWSGTAYEAAYDRIILDRLSYEATNPFRPSIGSLVAPEQMMPTVHGDVVFNPGQGNPGAPGSTGVTINGTRADYPTFEAYQDWNL